MASDTSFEVSGVDDTGAGIVEFGTGSGQRRSMAGALPGDRIVALEGELRLEPRASPARRALPLCAHFPACGGCQVQHMSDSLYDGWKGRKLAAALQAHGLTTAVPAGATLRMPLGSRRRAVLTAKQELGRYRLGFHEYRSHALVDIEDCAILSPGIMAALAPLKEIAHLVSGSRECRLTVLDVGTGLDVSAETDGKRQHHTLVSELTRLAAKARVHRLTVDGDPLLMRAKPQLVIAGIAVEPPPGAFVQASRDAEAVMTDMAASAIAKAKAKRVADLFCGIGTFALAIAHQARVLAVDADRAMVTALSNAARGGVGLKPIETKVRDLFRDPLSASELKHFDAVIFDPPRAGAKAQAEALSASSVRTVVAVSCNPLTLARDARTLVDGGYRLHSAQALDQFLFTPHIEAVVILER